MGVTPEEFNARMSKKVAQLTKVIYHLNTKNEDNEAALKLSTNHHRLELLNLLKQKDASTQRIAALQQELDHAHTKVAKLTKQNQDISEESRSKQEHEKMKENEQTLRQQAESLRKTLTAAFEKQQKDQVAKLQAQCDSRLQELELKLEQQSVEQGKLYTARVEQLQKEHERELIEKVEEKEFRIEELKAQLEVVQNESNVREELVVKVSTLEKTEMEAQLRLEEEERKREELTNQMARIQKANGFLEEKLTEVRREYEGRIKDLEAARDEQVSLHQTRAMSVEERSTQHIQALESSLASYKHERTELLEKVAALEESLEKSRAEGVRLSQDLSSMKAAKAEAEELHSKNTLELKRQLDDLRESLKVKSEAMKSTKGTIEGHLADANRLRKNLLSKEEQLSKVQAQLKGMKETLSSLKSSKKALKVKFSEATKTAKALKEQLAEATKTAIDQDLVLNNLQRTISELKHKLQAAEAAQASVAMEHSQITLETETRLEKLKHDHEGALATLSTSHNAAVLELEQEKDRVVVQMTDDHRSVLSHLNDNYQKSLTALQAKVDKLTKQNASMEKSLHERVRELDDKTYAEDKLKNKCVQLEDSLRRLETTTETLKNEHEASLQSIKEEAQAALKQAVDTAESKLFNTEVALKREHEEKLAQEKASTVALKKRHAGEVHQLSSSLQKASKALEELNGQQQKLLDSERTRTESLLEEAREKYAKERTALCSKHTLERELMAKEAEKVLEKQRSEWQAELNETIKSVKEQEAEKQAAMQEEKRRALEKAEARKSSLRYELEAKSSEQRLRLMEAHNRQMEEQRLSMSTSFDEKMRYLVDANTAQVSGLKKELAEKAEELRRLEGENVNLSNKYRDLEQEISRHKMEWRQQCINAEEAHKGTLKNVVSRYERAEKELIDRHVAEKAELNQLVQQKNARIDAEKQRVESTVREWKHKYEHRESRDEDVEEIRGLQEQLELYQARCRKAVEEMSFFKRELLNREENYNKVFGRAPNVGIMQVVAHRQGTTRKNKLSSSNLPPLGTDQSRVKLVNNNSNNNREESRPKRPGSASRDRARRYSVV